MSIYNTKTKESAQGVFPKKDRIDLWREYFLANKAKVPQWPNEKEVQKRHSIPAFDMSKDGLAQFVIQKMQKTKKEQD